ncbi:hypothetical protein ASC96_18710 [Rhizobium sp. Root1204]|nr:hypothetical protein ASC96_18710 [Rhizobium sp. Root1204]
MHATSILLVLIVMIVVASIFIPDFASANNISAILYTAAPVGVAAVGLALITLSGNLFVLSLSSTAALAAIIFASMLGAGYPLAIAGALLTGAVVGSMQGAVVVGFKTNPIITSIAATSLISAAGQYLSGGRTVLASGDVGWLGNGQLFPGLPVQALIFIAIVAIVEFFIERSRMGRELRLTGMNRAAAKLAGLRSSPAAIISYLVAGSAAAAAGVMIAAQTGAGNMRVGQDIDFSAIAAVLIGGIGIKGGKGRIIDAAVGAVFVAVLSNILLVYGFSYEVQLMVKGLAVIFSVILGAAFAKEKN